MKVLFFGGKGWIGGMFSQFLTEQGVQVIHTDVRADSDEAFTLISEGDYQYVVCMIGRTHGPGCPTIDYLQDINKVDINICDNLYAPLNLALACQNAGIHMTYLGTGCIFQYDEHHPLGCEETGFMEKDKPNFFGSAYSVVKGYTDRLMHLLPDTVLNLRIRMPITDDLTSPRNFITKILSYQRICSIPNSMSVLPTLFPAILKMMKMNVRGTVNLCNPGLISHNEILEMYKEYVNPDFHWTNFTIDEQDQLLKAKRSNNYLDTTFLTMIDPDIPDIKTAIRNILIYV